MKKRNIYISLALMPVTMLPFFSVVSCSKEPNNLGMYTTLVTNAINSKDIEFNIISEDRSLKLTDLDNNVKFEFKIKSSLSNDKNNQNYYENLKKAFNDSKIEFVDYLLPIFDSDINTYLFFKINNDNNSIVKIPLSSILLNGGAMSVANLTQIEISKLIQYKLNNQKYFISSLITKLKSTTSNIYEQYKIFITEEENKNISFSQYWKDNQFDDAIYYTLNDYFINNFIFFSNAEYKNLNIANLKINFETKNLTFSFDISTSNMNQYPETIYQVKDIKIYL